MRSSINNFIYVQDKYSRSQFLEDLYSLFYRPSSWREVSRKLDLVWTLKDFLFLREKGEYPQGFIQSDLLVRERNESPVVCECLDRIYQEGVQKMRERASRKLDHSTLPVMATGMAVGSVGGLVPALITAATAGIFQKPLLNWLGAKKSFAEVVSRFKEDKSYPTLPAVLLGTAVGVAAFSSVLAGVATGAATGLFYKLYKTYEFLR